MSLSQYLTFHRLDLLLKKDVVKGKITEEQRNEIRSRVKTTQDIQDFKQCDFVIEAVSENPALKRELFSALAKLTQPGTILASNTSSISITKIASACGPSRAPDVIGMHVSIHHLH